MDVDSAAAEMPPLPTEDPTGLEAAVRAAVTAQGDHARALAAAEAAELLIQVRGWVGRCMIPPSIHRHA